MPQSSSSRHISTTTDKRRLCAAGLHGKIAARKPLLRTGNKQKRLVWAKEHKEWTLDQWKSVLWSDESKCETFGSNHHVFVRCRKDEQMDFTCLVPTVKHGGGGVMVWGCCAGDTVGDLFKIEGILNQHGYHSILQQHAIPSSLRLVGPSFIFQQDNDPKHTSRLCKGYLTKKESNGVLRQMTWPPQSPDLNPIEMVWGELDHRVKAKGPTSAKHLWERLQDCWKTIPGDYLLKLIKRMPRVCKAVIKAKKVASTIDVWSLLVGREPIHHYQHNQKLQALALSPETAAIATASTFQIKVESPDDRGYWRTSCSFQTQKLVNFLHLTHDSTGSPVAVAAAEEMVYLLKPDVPEKVLHSTYGQPVTCLDVSTHQAAFGVKSYGWFTNNGNKVTEDVN
ncbi:unnamed protein product [Ranitomeya imitator]|uniref:Transposase Tc1-like domain-containing protein n=1 Tax=Ranitomeya imitator TaxID=111125 RepID=A0ABN9LD33_9NEOB|nr:unnamed protein product [Ranitomeya imitator]